MKYKISESQFFNMFLRRRLETFGKYVRATYKWLDARGYDNYDDFFTRVVFSSVRDFLFGEGNLDYATYDKLMDQVLPFMEKYVEKEYGDEIRKHFDKEISK
jgi:hypothetical protein